MCGICGILDRRAGTDSSDITRMLSLLHHRGPDHQGIWSDGPITLGHCRLSILDLSPLGNQPMQDHTSRYCLTYNGEIYNYHNIRKTLESKGCTFRSTSDTEVLLEAYKAWGVACVEHFNGMFAFAIWDKVEQTLFMARDRLGKKPLFFSHLPDNGLLFASELKAFKAAPGFTPRLNARALGQYLSLNYVLTNECIYQGVEKLAPGHCMLCTPEAPPRVWPYWDLVSSFQVKQKFASEDEAAEALLEIIDDAVRIRLVSDVPLGGFLSGGIDSTSVVSSMRHTLGSQRIKTFSIGFSEKGYSELDEARRAARFLEVDLAEKIVGHGPDTLLPVISHCADEPFADTSIIPMYHLAALAREQVIVALSGDGADEIMAGYETYMADTLHAMLGFVPRPLLRIANALARYIPADYGKVSTSYKIKRFLSGAHLPFAEAHYHWRGIFSQAELSALLPADLAAEALKGDAKGAFQSFFDQAQGLDPIDAAMYVDIKTWLPDDILVKVDRSTMAHSLEARAPYLDYRVVEFCAGLPVDLKLKSGRIKKYLLKKAQKQRVPQRAITRPKAGFNAPVSHWLAQGTGMHSRLLEMNASDGFFNPKEIQALWDDHLAKRRDNGLKLFNLFMFLHWKQLFL